LHASPRNFARYNEPSLRNLNDVAALAYRPAEQKYRAAIGSRPRWRDFNDFALNMEYVSGTGRCRPTHLSPGSDEAAGEWRTTLDIQTHRDRGGVPTARRQALEERPFRGLLVRVKGLRIELNRECPDLRFVKPVRSAGKALSDMKIVKIQLV
jgi:hypothetical protein